MLVRALNIDTSAYNNCANDVQAGAWYEGSVCYLIDNNIVDVDQNGDFGVTKNILRVKGAEWLYLTFNVQQGWPFPGSLYQDVDTADWYSEYVNVLGAYEIFQVNAGDSFRPAEVLLRGEADYWTTQAEAVL